MVTKKYNYNGLAGCVIKKKVHQTGTEVGVYHGLQSGMDCDEENPWVTVCEVHSNLASHPTLKLALDHSVDPQGWCEDCHPNKKIR